MAALHPNLTSGNSTAVVIGSGISGLATAQVLTKFFEHVILVEKDKPLPVWSQSAVDAARQQSAVRPGVAQYNQLHLLLAKGFKVLDQIFGGCLAPALAAGGASIVNQYPSYVVFNPVSGFKPWLRNNTAKEPALVAVCTRHLLETTIRQLVTENPRVKFIYSAAVSALSFSNDLSPAGPDAGGEHVVNGVVLSDGRHLSAQLVVDCSGRGSSLPTWLKAAGYDRPRTSRATCHCGYACWLCKLAPEVDRTLRSCNVHGTITMPDAPVTTFSLVQRVEGDMYIVSIGGNDRMHPGRSLEERMQFAVEKVWHPCVGRLLAGSTALTPPTCSYDISSTWRHYEEVSLPDGLVVLGDSICSFSPAYGQGMTVAAIEVSVLEKLLAQRAAQQNIPLPDASCRNSSNSGISSTDSTPADSNSALMNGRVSSNSDGKLSSSSSSSSSTVWLSNLGNQVLVSVLPTIKSAWQLAVGNDMRFATAISNEPTHSSMIDSLGFAYVRLLFRVAPSDSTVQEALLRSIHMLDEPQALMHPRVLSRVLIWFLNERITGCLQSLVASWAKGRQITAAARQPQLGNSGTCREPPALMQLMGVSPPKSD